MAETRAFILASNVLSTITSPAFVAAYEEQLFSSEAKDELSMVQTAIQSIHDVLVDAEMKQKGSADVRDWIKRVKSILYDAEDLFDEIVTKQQPRKGNHDPIFKKVLVSTSKLNQINSQSIVKEVKAIRKSLVGISTDMPELGFVKCGYEDPKPSIKTRPYTDSEDLKAVIGRDNDKKSVLEMLLSVSYEAVPVIAIVGIEGVGKTTLAYLIYKDVEVQLKFDDQWFVHRTNTTDERTFLTNIFQTICKVRGGTGFSEIQLETKIRDSVKGKKVLVVLDGVWDDCHGTWERRMSLFSTCAKGSRILVTTRSPLVVKAMNAQKSHNLKCLSAEDAWCLFKTLAIAPTYENLPSWELLGNLVAERCRCLPLAISTVGSHLNSKPLQEWEDIECEGIEGVMRRYEEPTPSMWTRPCTRSFVDPETVIGRDEDKNAVLEMLLSESYEAVPVIAIVGIQGVGKTTLASLIYYHVEVQRNFDYRWFVSLSTAFDEREYLEKIFQSVCEERDTGFSEIQLETKIMDFVKDKKFLVVLDGVRDDRHGRWKRRKRLFSSCAKGSMILVTTRLLSVVKAMTAHKSHNLGCLSAEDAWCLFKSLTSDPTYRNDRKRELTGKSILERCRGVPLAIWIVGNLLYSKTLQEWEDIEREGIEGMRYSDETLSLIKLSYHQLPSNLKHCVAYCSLYPKDYRFMKQELVCLWSAQGYIQPDEEDTVFLHFLRHGFFQQLEEDEFGEITSCKIYALIHDLALYVACEETIVLTSTTWNMTCFPLHVNVEDCERDELE